MFRGHTDKPVRNATEDTLEAGHYVAALSDFILDCESPMTIAIQGDWGSGKTSMMNLVRESLDGKVVTVWFNTWQHSQFEMGNQLPLTMIGALLECLGGDNTPVKKFMNMLSGIGRIAATAVTEKALGGAVAGQIGAQDSIDLAKELEKLHKALQAAVDKKLQEGRLEKVVVFVDDLDRLAPQKAVELLEVMKLFLDLPRTVFVLAVDYGIVTHGIRAKYGTFVDERKGRSFFDKLIQLPFVVPINQYHIDNYIRKLLKSTNTTDLDENDARLYKELVETSVGFNPRGLKRLFNAFSLLCNVARRRSVFENSKVSASIVQRALFAVLCLQMAYEQAYECLLKQQGDLSAKFLQELRDPEKLRRAENLKDIYAAVDSNAEGFAEFWEVVFAAIQTDEDDERISSEELELFRRVLGFSAITSNLDSESVGRQRKPRHKDDFLESCKANKTYFDYHTKLFEFLASQGLMDGQSLFFGTQGFSFKKSVRCYPPGVKKCIELDLDRLRANEAACNILQQVGISPERKGKKYLPVTMEKLPIERMLELLGAL